jgi:hypothetical protein
MLLQCQHMSKHYCSVLIWPNSAKCGSGINQITEDAASGSAVGRPCGKPADNVETSFPDDD